MFFRRHRRPSLLKLLLVILGLGFLVKRHDKGECCKGESHKEHKAKLKEFRSKLREAFDVWHEDEEAEEEKKAPEAEPTGNTGTI